MSFFTYRYVRRYFKTDRRRLLIGSRVDLPAIIATHVGGRAALDFGCGAGRSTRFLKRLGFDAIGIDVSSQMIELARGADPDGRYQLVGDADLRAICASRLHRSGGAP